MDNLSFENIAVGAVIVGVFNLIIVLLVKTETILKIIERIKGVIGLDYRNRAKRSDDEIRIYKKHPLVARERVKHSFVTMKKWNCKWVWNWNENFEPINIKGYCTGDTQTNLWERHMGFICNHPVEAYYSFPVDNDGNRIPSQSNFSTIEILCTNTSDEIVHQKSRARFEINSKSADPSSSYNTFMPIITKAILAERDLRVAREIKKLRLQFWR